MSGTTFNGVLSSGTFDQGKAAFYREQEEQRRLREHVERSAQWLAGRLVGQSFTTINDLLCAAVDEVEAHQGGIDDEMAATVSKAVTLLWLGKVTRDLRLALVAHREGDTLRFVAA